MFRRFNLTLHPIRRATSALALCLSIVAGLAAAPSTARAQTELPVAALSLTDEQKSAIAKHITDHSTKLAESDAAALRRDRSKLVEPLQAGQVSAAFRLEYSRKLAPALPALIRSKQDIVAINAAVVAGELATDEGIDLVIEGLKSESAPVRYQSAAGARRSFETLQASAEAMSGPAAERLVTALADRLGKESDPLVIDGAVRGLLGAAAVAKPAYSSARVLAVAKLAEGLSKRQEFAGDKPVSTTMLQTALTACGGLRDQIAGAGNSGLGAQGFKDAAEFTGHVLAHIARVARSGAMPAMAEGGSPTPVRELYAQLAQLSETVMLSAGRATSSQFQGSTRDLAAKLRGDSSKSDGEFVNEIAQIAGPGGVLSKPPFEFPANRFKLR